MKKRGLLAILLFCFPGIVKAQQAYYTAEEIQLPLQGVTLYGTIFSPAGIKNPPVVLIIAGSGPTDRDGNSPLIKGKNNSLLQLADSLARHGIASLRYDKRAIGKSIVKNLVEDSIHFTDGVNDAYALCQFLQTRNYKKIFIAGHSEGSLVGMAVASRFKAAGFISIAGAGRRADLVLKEQMASLPDTLRMLSYNYLDSLAAGKRISKPNIMLYNIFRPSVQPYMISWMQYDPQKIIQSLKCPVLIAQGTNDLQVKESDALNLKSARPSATLLLVKSMNHVLKAVQSESKTENQKAYSDPSLPVMHELIVAMINFIVPKRK